MSGRRLGSVLAMTLASWLVGGAASAQETSRAQRLFDEAKSFALADRYPEACPLLEESLRLDPALGTMFNLADCNEHIGRLASALRMFRRVEAEARVAGQGEREVRAHQRAAALEGQVARLTVEVPPAARVDDLRVFYDGEQLPASVWSAALPVDVGEHEVRAEARDRQPWRTVVSVKENGGATRILVPLLKVPMSGPESASVAAHPAPAASSPGRTAAIVIGSVGLAGLAAGGVFGLLSVANHTECPGGCAGAERDRQSNAYVAGNASTIAFSVGAVAMVASVFLWFSSPPRRDLHPATR